MNSKGSGHFLCMLHDGPCRFKCRNILVNYMWSCGLIEWDGWEMLSNNIPEIVGNCCSGNILERALECMRRICHPEWQRTFHGCCTQTGWPQSNTSRIPTLWSRHQWMAICSCLILRNGIWNGLEKSMHMESIAVITAGPLYLPPPIVS